VCGKRGLRRKFKKGGSFFIHGNSGVWVRGCRTVDSNGKELFKEIHKGRWVKAL